MQDHDITVISYSTVPSPPTRLAAKALSDNQIEIRWGPVAVNGGDDVNSFVLNIVEMDTGTPAIGNKHLKGNLMVYSQDGLNSNTTYR